MSYHPHPHPPYPPHQPVSPYHDPQRPIPYRGHPVHPSFLSHGSFSQESSQATKLDPTAGGWDAPGPLLQERARRGLRLHPRVRQRSTDNWVRNSAQPPYGMPPPAVAPQEVVSQHHINASLSRMTIGEIPLGQSPINSATEEVAAEEETSPVAIGDDGWPVAPPSTPPSPGEPVSQSAAEAVSSETSSIEVVIDPISTRSSSPVTPVEVPTAPPTFVPGVHGAVSRAPHLQPAHQDPNVFDVVDPRPWGRLQDSTPTLADDRSTSPETLRPDSAPPIAPAVTAFVSSDEEEQVPTDQASSPSSNGSPDQPPDGTPDQAPDETPNQPLQSVRARRRRPSISVVEADGCPIADGIGDGPRSRYDRYRGPGAQGAWWKKDPHPAYSYRFADRRVIVNFPFPVRLEVIKTMLFDHFSKYGAVRCVFHQNATPEAADKAIVVFRKPESVDKCLDDPERTHCILRADRNISKFEINIERGSVHAMTRTILIKFTGPRVDARSRPASRSSTPGEKLTVGDCRPLPRKITVWAFPYRLRKSNRIEWWARIAVGDSPEAFIIDKARLETRQEPVQLDTIDLRRRVPENQILPRLCDYFADLVDITPPTSRSQGWLVCVSGQRDAERVMNEVGRIPGITTRWATEADGMDNNSAPTRSPGSRSPMSRFEKYCGAKVARALKQFPREPASPTPTKSFTSSALMTPPPSPPHSAVDLPSEYPYLRKLLAPTYHGRLLKEDRSSDGEIKYTDESAVFVGRVVKEQETVTSLFERFAKYGPICHIEYKSDNVRTTYATARVLFADPESAARALQFEVNAVSFGSSLKIELRRVLPADVRMREIYMDEIGRPISPSMVAQYSPPSMHLPPQNFMGPTSGPIFCDPAQTPQLAPPPPGHPGHPAFWPIYVGAGGAPHPPQPSPLYVGPPPPALNPPSGQPQPFQNVGYMPIYPHPSVGAPMTPVTPSGPPQFPVSPPAQIDDPSVGPADTSQVQAPQRFDRDPPQSPMAPKIAGYKSENGVFKVVYDPDDLKRYQVDHGIPTEPPTMSLADANSQQDIQHPLQRPHTSPGRPRSGMASQQDHRRASLAPMQRAVPIPIPFVSPRTQSQASQRLNELMAPMSDARPPPIGRWPGGPGRYVRSPGPMGNQNIGHGSGW